MMGIATRDSSAVKVHPAPDRHPSVSHPLAPRVSAGQKLNLRSRKAKARLLLFLIGTWIVAVSLVAGRAALADYSYRKADMESGALLLEREIAKLKVEVAVLASAERLSDVAGDMGLQLPSPAQVIRVTLPVPATRDGGVRTQALPDAGHGPKADRWITGR